MLRMFETSTSQVRLPSAADFIFVLLDQSGHDSTFLAYRPEFLPIRYPVPIRTSFTALAMHMDMDTGFFTGKEEETQLSASINRWGQPLTKALGSIGSRENLPRLQHPLRRKDLSRQPLFQHRRLIECLGESFEDGFHDVVGVPAIE